MEKPPLKNDETVRAFIEQHPTLCAAVTLSGRQYVRYQIAFAALLLIFLYDWKIFAASALFSLSAFYVAVIGYKLLTVFISLLFKPEIKIPEEMIGQIVDDDLPVYTVLVPMYREPEVAQKIVRAVDHLDYPHDKLDIKLLLEEDDPETLARCREIELPSCVEVMVVPHAMPKTKPKACNHGLFAARGKYLVIYDAEDMPDSDQLKKSVLAFRGAPENVVCLQAKLNYYNPYQNLLTKWFTLEYSAWFDLFLPGLHALDVPIPLGGTSNHFQTDILRRLGGWDPFNLTEDCDLGMRLHRRGYRTMVLDSTTWEEANSRLGNWIRQRSRWVKGYIQTHFVHTRSNLRTLWRLGPKAFLSFLLTVGGLSLTLLLNPVFWVIAAAYLALVAGDIAGISPAPWDMGWKLRYFDRVSDLPGSDYTVWSQLSWGFWAAAVGLATANGIFVVINLIACVKRRLWRLLPYAFISPLYWVIISIAAWKGFLQLFSRPFYWEKTIHGLSEKSDDQS